MPDIFDYGIGSGCDITQGYESFSGSACTTNILVDSVVNGNNGLTVLLVLSGTPVGSVKFYISHTPILSSLRQVVGTVDTGLNTSPPTYNITLPHAGLWYIWAVDDDGITQEPGAVWMDGVADSSDIDLTGAMIRDTLIANTLGIEAIMHRSYPDSNLEQVVYGYEGAIVDYPSILISSPRVQDAYVAFPFTREATYSFTIQ